MPQDHGDPIDREDTGLGYPCDTGISSDERHDPIGRHYSDDEDNFYTLDPSDPEYDPNNPNRKFKGYCWKLCPFSTAWAARYPNLLAGQGSYREQVRVGGAVTYQFKKVPQSEQRNHTRTNGRMRFAMRGTVVGWVCDDLNCYYYTTENPGTKFFQV